MVHSYFDALLIVINFIKNPKGIYSKTSKEYLQKIEYVSFIEKYYFCTLI